MDQKVVIDSIKKVRELSKKRNFSQSFDIIVNLQQLNVKDPNQKVDLFLQLPHPKGKKAKICALVGQELETKAKVFDKVINKSEFPTYQKNIKKVKKLAREYDFFLAQANLMAEIAAAFGKGLGTVGKMPNPKAGCIVPPVIPSLEPIKAKLDNTTRLITKDQLIVKGMIGLESMKDEEIAANFLTAYNTLLQKLPKEANNIKSVYLKLTMSPSVQVTDKGPVVSKKIELKSNTPKKVENGSTRISSKEKGS